MKRPKETLPRDVVLSGANNVRTNFRGHHHLKFGVTKNVQNLAEFRTTFKFEREYFWNRWRYRQAVNGVINYRPSRVEQKKLGELWSTNDNG